METELNQKIVKELFDYDPKTGRLSWRKRDLKWFKDGKKTAEQAMNTWNAQNAGKQAFTHITDGYFRGNLTISGKKFRLTAHRVAYLWHHGYMPDMIDHENHIRTDNRISNLVETDVTGNSKNLSKTSKNTSGFVGITERKIKGKPTGRWRPFITIKKKTIFLGETASLEEAIKIREEALKEHGFHKNHGQ